MVVAAVVESGAQVLGDVQAAGGLVVPSADAQLLAGLRVVPVEGKQINEIILLMTKIRKSLKYSLCPLGGPHSQSHNVSSLHLAHIDLWADGHASVLYNVGADNVELSGKDVDLHLGNAGAPHSVTLQVVVVGMGPV